MAVDVSGLVSMLATQPAQGMAQMGGQLLAAQESVREREQQAFENLVTKSKLALEKQVKDQEITLNELKIASERDKLGASVAQSLLSVQDPLARQQMLLDATPTLKTAGYTDEQLSFAMQNVNDNGFLTGMQARAVGADRFLTEASKVDKATMDDYTRALAKRDEIRDQLKRVPNDAALQQDLRDTNARIAKLTTITGRTPQDMTTTQRARAEAELGGMQQTLDQLNNLAEEYAKNPNVSGVVGSIKENLGSLAEQFLGETGTQISTGLGTEKARQLRTQTRLALGKLLPVITGDTSGRYTDKEKEFAEETLGGLDKLSSDKAVETSLREIITILEDSERRLAERLGKTLPKSQTVQPPQAAIDYLKANPSLSKDFDAKYGEGASSKYLGQ